MQPDALRRVALFCQLAHQRPGVNDQLGVTPYLNRPIPELEVAYVQGGAVETPSIRSAIGNASEIPADRGQLFDVDRLPPATQERVVLIDSRVHFIGDFAAIRGKGADAWPAPSPYLLCKPVARRTFFAHFVVGFLDMLRAERGI